MVAAHPGQRVVVVDHGGVIGELARARRSGPPTVRLHRCRQRIDLHLVVSDDRWVVRRFNDTAHLADGFDLDAEPSLPEGG